MSFPSWLAGQVASALNPDDLDGLFREFLNESLIDESAGQTEQQREHHSSNDQSTEVFTAASPASSDDQSFENQHGFNDEGYNTQLTAANSETQVVEDADNQALEPIPQNPLTEDDTTTLIRLLNKHKDNNTLSEIFKKHPKILGSALTSLEDDDNTLFKFLSKHKQAVGRFLEKQQSPEILAEFLAKYPALMNVILDEERSIIENFLRDHPDALNVYLDVKAPTVLNDFMEANPEKFHAYMHAHPKMLSDFCDKHPKFMAVWLKNRQKVVQDYLVSNPALFWNHIAAHPSCVSAGQTLQGRQFTSSLLHDIPEDQRHFIRLPIKWTLPRDRAARRRMLALLAERGETEVAIQGSVQAGQAWINSERFIPQEEFDEYTEVDHAQIERNRTVTAPRPIEWRDDERLAAREPTGGKSTGIGPYQRAFRDVFQEIQPALANGSREGSADAHLQATLAATVDENTRGVAPRRTLYWDEGDPTETSDDGNAATQEVDTAQDNDEFHQAIENAREIEETQNTGDTVEVQGTQEVEDVQEDVSDEQEFQDAQEEQDADAQETHQQQDKVIPSVEQDETIPNIEISEDEVDEVAGPSNYAERSENKNKGKALDCEDRNKRRQKQGVGSKRPTRTTRSTRSTRYKDEDQEESEEKSSSNENNDDNDFDFNPSKPKSRAITRAQSREQSQVRSQAPPRNKGKAAAVSKRASTGAPKSKSKPRQAKPIPSIKGKERAISIDSDDEVEESEPDFDPGAETDDTDAIIASIPAISQPHQIAPMPSLNQLATSSTTTAVPSSAAISRALIPYPAPAAALAADALRIRGPREWTLREEDCGIKHMLAIRDENLLNNLIKGEDRFAEAANRMNAELGTNRVGTAFKNFWNRAGRARSGYDERRSKRAPLATSLQDKITKAKRAIMGKVRRGGGRRKKAVKEEEDDDDDDDDDEDEDKEEEKGTRSSSVSSSASAGQKRKSEGEDEEFELDSDTRSFAFGTRQKKKVKYTF